MRVIIVMYCESQTHKCRNRRNEGVERLSRNSLHEYGSLNVGHANLLTDDDNEYEDGRVLSYRE